MSMRDQYGNELLEPSQREIHADKHIWGVYKVQRGSQWGECVMSCMTLPDAKEEARRRNEEIETGGGSRSGWRSAWQSACGQSKKCLIRLI